jgi:hypothetical protein
MTKHGLRPVMLNARASLDNQHLEVLNHPHIIALLATSDLPLD